MIIFHLKSFILPNKLDILFNSLGKTKLWKVRGPLQVPAPTIIGNQNRLNYLIVKL